MKKKLPIIVLLGFLLLILIINKTNAIIFEDNDVKVEPNTDLIYYLDIYYDGVDRYGVQSNDKTIAEIRSGTINITDKLPAGLIFNGFVQSGNGSIGAVKRSDGSVCSGYVVNGSSGLNYNSTTNTVTFQIKNMQAGCKITVGIKTKTPTIDDPATSVIEFRRDFYNTAEGQEGEQTIRSNTVHVWMGTENAPTHTVSYSYTGTVPAGAPSAPASAEYAVNGKVSVANPVNVEGYTFSGWKTSDATVTNGSFTMPNKNVTFTGSFTENPKYSVTYNITGAKPAGYTVPVTKSYYGGSQVRIDTLTPGVEIGGYRFKGWTYSGITVDQTTGEFAMPNSNVTITGSFELITYKVKYEYSGTVVPPNGNTLLPATQNFAPGTEVTVASNLANVTGYIFNGWNKTGKFTMPEEDVTITGSWRQYNGTFELGITASMEDNKYYKNGDTPRTIITITNPNSFAVQNVMVKNNSPGSIFRPYDLPEPNTNLIINSDEFLTINEIPANSTISLLSRYEVTQSDPSRTYLEYEIVGASNDNYYFFDTSKEYKATTYFDKAAELSICETSIGSTNKDFSYNITGTGYQSWVVLTPNTCNSIYLEPGTYRVKEIIPADYILQSITGPITKNNDSFSVASGEVYELMFTNKYNNKSKYYHAFGRIINTVYLVD